MPYFHYALQRVLLPLLLAKHSQKSGFTHKSFLANTWTRREIHPKLFLPILQFSNEKILGSENSLLFSLMVIVQ